MAVREGADAHVLAGEAHVVAFVEQRRVGQRLRIAPVHRRFAVGHEAPVVEHLAHLAVQRKVVRHGVGAFGQLAQPRQRHAGVRRSRRGIAEIGPPVHEQRRVRFVDEGQRHAVAGVQRVAVETHQRLGLFRRHGAFGDQPIRIDAARGRMLGDRPVHQRLGLRRVFGFVVAAPPIAHEVDDDVLPEAHPVVHRQLRGEDAGLRVVAVDVQDGRLHELGDLRAVLGGAGVLDAVGGEADLVVDDEVYRSAHPEAARLRHLQGLHHHALASEGGIAVQDERHHLVAFVVAASILAGAHRAGHHRGDDFQVRRVERQREVHLAAGGHHVGRKALVVLHVAVAVGLGHHALELVEQVLGILAENVHQHVQPTAMRHADHRLHAALLAEALQRFVQHADQRFRAFEAEALGAREARVQVPLQPFGGAQAVEDVEPRFGGKSRRAVRGFEAFAHPKLLLGVRDVHVFGAEGAAVDALQGRHDVAQRGARGGLLEELRRAGVEHGVQVRVREAVVAQFQFRHRGAFPEAERIEPRPAVAAVAVGADQFENADLRPFVRRRHIRRHPLRARLEAVAPQPLEVPHHAAVGHVRRVVAFAGQAVEVAAPLLGDVRGVFQIRLEERLHVGVAGGKVGAGAQAGQVRGIHPPLALKAAPDVRGAS